MIFPSCDYSKLRFFQVLTFQVLTFQVLAFQVLALQVLTLQVLAFLSSTDGSSVDFSRADVQLLILPRVGPAKFTKSKAESRGARRLEVEG